MHLDIQETKYKELSIKLPVLIFGAGKFAQDLCTILVNKNFKVLGFCQTEVKEDRVLGLPVFKLSEIETFDDYQVVLGVFNRETPFGALVDQLPDKMNVFFLWEIYTQFEQEFGWRYWLSNPNTILDNKTQINEVYNILQDSRSRFCLEHICKFRLGSDLLYGNYRDVENQYFNNITLDPFKFKAINYLDAGAYNGDSFKNLLAYSRTNNAYLFEPGKNNYKELCQNVVEENVMCFPLAVADENKIISFNSEAGEASSILDNGKDSIAAVALDDLFAHISIDFIKLDIEGAESLAIKGLEKTIKTQKPVIAMSLYHKPKDIFELPNAILNIDNNYSLYIRQHYYNSFDCVLYAVPRL